MRFPAVKSFVEGTEYNIAISENPIHDTTLDPKRRSSIHTINPEMLERTTLRTPPKCIAITICHANLHPERMLALAQIKQTDGKLTCAAEIGRAVSSHCPELVWRSHTVLAVPSSIALLIQLPEDDRNLNSMHVSS